MYVFVTFLWYKQVGINGEHFADYENHNLNSSINAISIDGAVTIRSIQLLQGLRAPYEFPNGIQKKRPTLNNSIDLRRQLVVPRLKKLALTDNTSKFNRQHTVKRTSIRKTESKTILFGQSGIYQMASIFYILSLSATNLIMIRNY